MNNVATVGCRFRGRCDSCGDNVDGTLITGEFATIEGKNICVVGSKGVGDCGHNTYVVSGSTVWSIEGKPVARVGDRVNGIIDGTIITGEFVLAD